MEVEDEHVDFGLLVGVHVLAVAVLFTSDLGVHVSGLFVLLQLSTMLFLYCGAALFTEPESSVADRETVVPAGPSDWIDRRFDADSGLSVPRLPPLNLKNLRFVVPSFLLGLVLATGIGAALTVEGGFSGKSRGSGGASLTELFQQFVVFKKPLVALAGILLIAAESVRFYRCHVATGRYRQWTTHMMLTPLVQYLSLAFFVSFFFALYAVLTLLTFAIGAASIVGDSLGRTLWIALLLTSGLVLKLAIEWGRVRGERQLDVPTGSRLVAYFTPTPPND
ncbi:hypothetical protein [Halovenus salina]|uniref:Uncharacterized protein n=1 Tax=Halovenus salina TaxID=1510225 RepID=A0ABD5W1B4_9EURY|nr:hypothetical protein [Halovenus salina]